MPRSNRPRSAKRAGSPSAAAAGDDEERESIERLLTGTRTVEHRRTGGRTGDWNVQPISAAQATKEYMCPGCLQVIAPGIAHLVAWRADGVLGDTADLAARRHWHTHCWRIN